MSMKIAVMGTGAIGGYLGARLAEAGAEVGFIARGPHLAAIREHGLKVTSPNGDMHVNPATASDDPADLGPADVVLFGVKLYDVAGTAAAMRPLLKPDTAVVTLQNGVDAPGIVDEVLGDGHAMPSVVMINAVIAGPGVIQHNALNGLIVGEPNGGSSDRLRRFADLAGKTGVEITVSPDIRLELWRKFMLLASMGGISATTRVPLARILDTPETWRLAREAMAEVVAVGNAQGVALSKQDIENTLAFVQTMPPTWRASLTVDLLQGKKLEVEWLSGTLCRLGAEAGIDTPFHRFVLGMLLPHAGGNAT
ncbi:MAG: 2-dehydropantoate 2-reductase [Alphaproteobacteria bacterium]